jgi:hypothetical protein
VDVDSRQEKEKEKETTCAKREKWICELELD